MIHSKNPANFHTLIPRAFIKRTQIEYDENYSLKQDSQSSSKNTCCLPATTPSQTK